MKKRMEGRSKLFARKKLFSGCLNKFQCHTMQELAMTDEYARFVKRTILHSTFYIWLTCLHSKAESWR